MAKTIEELAPCGTDCQPCEVLRVTVHGGELNPEVIRSWRELAREHWEIPNLDPGTIRCRGCRDASFMRFPGCPPCPIIGCLKQRGLKSCGLCADLITCPWQSEDSRENLLKATGTDEQ